MSELLLASASPRRADLLRLVGIAFRVVENHHVEDTPLVDIDQLGALAIAKARSVDRGECRGLIIGADTVVVCDGKILTKPKDQADALAMLTLLSGRDHLVMTAVAIVAAEDRQILWQKTCTTTVSFRTLTAADIQAYLQTREYIDKAGAYGIQGYGALLVEKICGCYYNIVGLPLSLLAEGLGSLGVNVYEYNHQVYH